MLQASGDSGRCFFFKFKTGAADPGMTWRHPGWRRCAPAALLLLKHSGQTVEGTEPRWGGGMLCRRQRRRRPKLPERDRQAIHLQEFLSEMA